MNDKKQIEEMAVIMTNGGCTKCNCDLDGKFNCLSLYEAELLYNAGYRKQREGEWIIQGLANPKCSACNRYNRCGDKHDFCPNCGAKMKGGAE